MFLYTHTGTGTLRSGMSGLYSKYMKLSNTSKMVFPSRSECKFSFLFILINTWYKIVILANLIGVYVVLSHDFNYHFPND